MQDPTPSEGGPKRGKKRGGKKTNQPPSQQSAGEPSTPQTRQNVPQEIKPHPSKPIETSAAPLLTQPPPSISIPVKHEATPPLAENPNKNKNKQKNKGNAAKSAQQPHVQQPGLPTISPLISQPFPAQSAKQEVTQQPTVAVIPNIWSKQKNKGNASQLEPQPRVQKAVPQLTAPRTVPELGQIQMTQGLRDMTISSPTKAGSQIPAKDYSADNTLGIKIPKRPPQPDKEKRGRRVMIETNHLEIKLNKLDEVIHYDVEITPDKPKVLMVPIMTQYIKINFPGRHPAFDGNKNLYSSGSLFDSQVHFGTVDITEDGRDKPTQFQVKVQFAARIDLNGLFQYTKSGTSKDPPQSSIQCLDVVMRHSSHQKFVKVGRSFFSAPQGQVYSLGGGLDLWYGHFQSAVLGWKPFLNVDVAHKGFSKHQAVLDLIGELDRSRDPVLNTGNYLDPITLASLKKYIRNLKVEYQIPRQASSRRTYRVNEVLDAAERLTFELDGRKMTIFDYFRKERNYTIRYPRFPCLGVGNKQKKIYYPVELCTILGGQNVLIKMDGNQTTNLIRKAATPAYERRKKIEEIVQKSNFKNDDVIKDFGISISDKFEAINARILEPPNLQYKNRNLVPINGVWNADVFFTGANLQRWSILILDRIEMAKVQGMVKDLQFNGSKLGMNVSNPVSITQIQLRDLALCLANAGRDALQMVLVVVNAFKNDYAQVKQIAELQHGVLTQCIQGKTVFKMNASTAQMLLQKINSKLDQTNHKIALVSRPPCLEVPCMIVGADVTHPSPGQDDIPSIAAVAASHDPSAYKYNITLRIQPAKMEIITDLASMIKEQLQYFYKVTKHQPKKIIMFRDGVSEGQFEQVLNAELTAIRAACKSLHANYQPQISMFIVQKRHHTRFFPTNPRDADRKGNALAGTCIDTTITHPTEMDFYLLSHASIQGTARPTKYHCIWDDSNMKEDEVEHLAYYLCHLYSRCTRAVSYPTPTYYAHLAAARARVLTENVRFDMNNLQNEQDRLKICSGIKETYPMFFV